MKGSFVDLHHVHGNCAVVRVSHRPRASERAIERESCTTWHQKIATNNLSKISLRSVNNCKIRRTATTTIVSFDTIENPKASSCGGFLTIANPTKVPAEWFWRLDIQKTTGGGARDANKSKEKLLRMGFGIWKSTKKLQRIKKSLCGWVLTLENPRKSFCVGALTLGNPKGTCSGRVLTFENR